MRIMTLLKTLTFSVLALCCTLDAADPADWKAIKRRSKESNEYLVKMDEDNAKRARRAEKERKDIADLQEEIQEAIQDAAKRMEQTQADSKKYQEKQDKKRAKLNRRIATITTEIEKQELNVALQLDGGRGKQGGSADFNKKPLRFTKEGEKLQQGAAPPPGGQDPKPGGSAE
jgi:Skp family chaperone for outer membrane proteins